MRILLGLIWIIAMLAGYGLVGMFGIYIGVLGTDSCRGVDGYAVVYLFFIWPAILAFVALAPPVLFLFRASVWAIVLSLVGGVIIAGVSFILYMPILQMACRPITRS